MNTLYCVCFKSPPPLPPVPVSVCVGLSWVCRAEASATVCESAHPATSGADCHCVHRELTGRVTRSGRLAARLAVTADTVTGWPWPGAAVPVTATGDTATGDCRDWRPDLDPPARPPAGPVWTARLCDVSARYRRSSKPDCHRHVDVWTGPVRPIT